LADCLACRVHRGEISPPGGILYDDGLWRLEHSVNPTPLLGWLVAKPLRHVEFLDELSEDEAQAMATVLRRAVGALRHALPSPPAKVYTALFAESAECPHIHFHIIPRAVDDPRELRGPRVFERMRRVGEGLEEGPSLEDVEDLATRIRSHLRMTAEPST